MEKPESRGRLGEILPRIAPDLDEKAEELRSRRSDGLIRKFDAASAMHNIRATAASLPEAEQLNRGPGVETQYPPAAKAIFDKLYDLQRK